MTMTGRSNSLPSDGAWDSTLALLREGYDFIPRRCRRLHSDVFTTRLMLRRAVCISGRDAVAQFYVPGRFTRRGAMPTTTLTLLQDRGSVQTLDGEAHRQRKRLFLGLMSPQSIQRLVALADARWQARIRGWEARGGDIVLLDEVREILCGAACDWAGVPLGEGELEERTREFAAMIDGSGMAGPRNWRGQLLRRRSERWIRGLVEEVRQGRLSVPADSALQAVASHRDADGSPLPAKVAAVELINLLRPTVAVALYIVFAAHALHRNPEWRERLAGGSDAELEAFTQEVRRLYPFFPMIGGRVLQPFEWRGHRFEEGDWVLADLHGTNHDPRLWPDPEAFRPERFLPPEPPDENALVPQGGGDVRAGHRCPGEWITIALVKGALRQLCGAMRYEVPPQDLTIDLSRMPAAPQSGFILRNVRQGA